MKKYLQNIIRLALLAVAVTPLLATAAPALVYAGAVDDICTGVNIGGQGGCGSNAEGRISGVVAAAINIFSLVVGIAAVIMVIVSGLKYITSVGDASSVNSAKNTLLYAIVGLIIVALAQFVVRFVLEQV